MKALTCILLWSTLVVLFSLPQMLPTESVAVKKTFCEFNEDCVNFYVCNQTTGKINADGRNIIPLLIRSQDDNRVPCTKEFHICCKIPTMEMPEPAIAALQTTSKMGCGYKSTGVVPRIKGPDTSTEIGEFPWMVAIFNKNPEKKYLAGGSLIHPSVVLTSAHKVKNLQADDLQIYAGKWSIADEPEVVNHQERKVWEIRQHSDYREAAFTNDIALLFLTEPLTMGLTVQTICLPPSDFDLTKLEYEECTVTGWGTHTYGEDDYQNTLKKIDLPFIGHESCENLLKTKKGIGDLFKDYKLHKSFVCAGGEYGKDACTGDGGSPLICPIEGQPKRYHQIGVVSWGIRCGEIDLPGMYANVAYLKSWIDEQMIEENYGTSTYTE